MSYFKGAKTGQQIAKGRYAGGGPVKDLPEPFGGMAERLDDEADRQGDYLASDMQGSRTKTRGPTYQNLRNKQYTDKIGGKPKADEVYGEQFTSPQKRGD